MNPAMSVVEFKLTSFWFKLRDLFSPPEAVLSEVGLEPGFHVLDYGRSKPGRSVTD
jgi:hypothetical protein